MDPAFIAKVTRMVGTEIPEAFRSGAVRTPEEGARFEKVYTEDLREILSEQADRLKAECLFLQGVGGSAAELKACRQALGNIEELYRALVTEVHSLVKDYSLTYFPGMPATEDVNVNRYLEACRVSCEFQFRAISELMNDYISRNAIAVSSAAGPDL